MAEFHERGDETTPASSGNREYSLHAIHLLRTAQLNNMTLSRMADQKASILMGATFVVFSLTVGRTVAGELSAPLIVLGVFAFASSLCAVAAVMPSIAGLPSDRKAANKLYFGHFALLDETEWTESLLDGLQTDESTFRMMLHDIHEHGQTLLHRKYRYLGYAYRVFVAGLVFTLIAFALERL